MPYDPSNHCEARRDQRTADLSNYYATPTSAHVKKSQLK